MHDDKKSIRLSGFDLIPSPVIRLSAFGRCGTIRLELQAERRNCQTLIRWSIASWPTLASSYPCRKAARTAGTNRSRCARERAACPAVIRGSSRVVWIERPPKMGIRVKKNPFILDRPSSSANGQHAAPTPATDLQGPLGSFFLAFFTFSPLVPIINHRLVDESLYNSDGSGGGDGGGFWLGAAVDTLAQVISHGERAFLYERT